MKGKYLITTDAWFYAPNGKMYKSAWVEVEILNDNDSLGIKTNARSTNWYAKIGSEENHIIIAGCQIHYSVKCNNKPYTEGVEDYTSHEGKFVRSSRPCNIYIAE